MHFSQIRSYDNYIVANLQLNLLKDQGISCYLQDEHTITIDPLLSPAIGGMKLMVLDAETETANQLLEAAEDNYLQTINCPACGEARMEKITHIENPVSRWQQWKLRILNGSPVSFRVQYKCMYCQAQYDQIPV